MKGQIKLNDYLRLRSESDLKEMVTLKGEVSKIIRIYKKNIDNLFLSYLEKKTETTRQDHQL